MDEDRRVFRIFVASTTDDLAEYREKAADVIVRMKNLPVRIDLSSAQGLPADECTREAAEADALVCIVAHRYGYVPTPEFGGDGERSITWLEVDAALRARKPVLPYVVKTGIYWAGGTEQDRLTSEPREKADEISRAVQNLKAFKTFLSHNFVLKTFKNPDEFATHLAIDLRALTDRLSRLQGRSARVWQPLFCRALQPAVHFRGRAADLDQLKNWLKSPVTPDRVVSIVAAGGTGKTALVHRALRDTNFSDQAGVFVWSFYEDPSTDAFLRAAYLYFTGETVAPASGLLERLQIALSGDAPHVLVLDGLEQVQSDGGELHDLQLKRLLKALAGSIGGARALATSRYPLADLEQFTGAGHLAIALDDLELLAALEVLRAWNVRGNDRALGELIEPLSVGGRYHALSITVLGSYLGNFAGGDPNQGPAFSLEDAKDYDPKARRLARILNHYARVLSPAERALLTRLSLFPQGVMVKVLYTIIQSGGEVAGALHGIADPQVLRHLKRLESLGLVFRFKTNDQVFYSAHPFLRAYFRSLLETRPESIYESVRAKMALSLESRPATNPRSAAILDQYAELVQQTVLAGKVREAFGLYWHAVGNYRNLGWALDENGRGIRILECFCPNDDFAAMAPHLTGVERSTLINDLGLFAKNLGDLSRARRAYEYCWELDSSLSRLGQCIECGTKPRGIGAERRALSEGTGVCQEGGVAGS